MLTLYQIVQGTSAVGCPMAKLNASWTFFYEVGQGAILWHTANIVSTGQLNIIICPWVGGSFASCKLKNLGEVRGFRPKSIVWKQSIIIHFAELGLVLHKENQSIAHIDPQKWPSLVLSSNFCTISEIHATGCIADSCIFINYAEL